MDDNPTPTHRWVADKIGFSIAGVSLLRNGQRLPSFDAMEAIESAFGWPMGEQVYQRENYSEVFELKIQKIYSEEIDRESNTPVE